jgi:hypothetical protein
MFFTLVMFSHFRNLSYTFLKYFLYSFYLECELGGEPIGCTGMRGVGRGRELAGRESDFQGGRLPYGLDQNSRASQSSVVVMSLLLQLQIYIPCKMPT